MAGVQRYGKRKRESFVGIATKSGTVRATLKKKFSWKQYPEVSHRESAPVRSAGSEVASSHRAPSPRIAQLEGYLLENQDEYFEYSSRNYTAEQRKYNNDLTRGLLELAAEGALQPGRPVAILDLVVHGAKAGPSVSSGEREGAMVGGTTEPGLQRQPVRPEGVGDL